MCWCYTVSVPRCTCYSVYIYLCIYLKQSYRTCGEFLHRCGKFLAVSAGPVDQHAVAMVVTSLNLYHGLLFDFQTQHCSAAQWLKLVAAVFFLFIFFTYDLHKTGSWMQRCSVVFWCPNNLHPAFSGSRLIGGKKGACSRTKRTF